MQKFSFNKGKNIVFIDGTKDPFTNAQTIVDMLNDDNVLIVATVLGCIVQFKNDDGSITDINMFTKERIVSIYSNSEDDVRYAINKTIGLADAIRRKRNGDV